MHITIASADSVAQRNATASQDGAFGRKSKERAALPPLEHVHEHFTLQTILVRVACEMIDGVQPWKGGLGAATLSFAYFVLLLIVTRSCRWVSVSLDPGQTHLLRASPSDRARTPTSSDSCLRKAFFPRLVAQPVETR